MTTTATATIATASSQLLELLASIERDDPHVQCLNRREEQPDLAYRLQCLGGLGLAVMYEASATYRLTAEGRDLLDRCTRN